MPCAGWASDYFVPLGHTIIAHRFISFPFQGNEMEGSAEMAKGHVSTLSCPTAETV
jgi:hypothetical protein